MSVPIVLSADQVWTTTSNGGLLVDSTAPVSGSGFDLTLSDVSGSNPIGLDGVISGSGTSVICQGSGRVELGGANTYTGGTVVSAGTLRLLSTAGSATGTGGVTVESNGVLDGDGAIAGSLDNAGRVDPGGTLSVGGGYTQQATGHLDIRLQGAGAGQFDQLAIGGPAVLGGTLNVTTSFFTPSAGQQFTLMTYASKTGDFATVNLPTVAGVCLFLQIGPTGVTLIVASGSDCPAACCLANGTCANQTQTACQSAGGVYQGSGTDCASATCGACCLADGNCTGNSPAQCQAAGGAYQGDATDCDSAGCGACCLNNGTCTGGNASQCLASGGAFQGAGTDCGSAGCGACCKQDGSCTPDDSAGCLAAGGTHQGAGSDCAAAACGACCLEDGSCLDTSASACTTVGGDSQGVGTACEATQCDQPAQPKGEVFTYQGRLSGPGGTIGGPVDMIFTLWEHSSSTNPNDQVGVTLTFDGAGGNPPPVQVTDGLFTASLAFGPSAFDGNARWLDIQVRAPSGAGGYEALTPRQRVTAAPSAMYALDAPPGHSLDAVDGTPMDAVFVDADGKVGIGSESPSAKLDVAGGIVCDGPVGIGTSTPTSLLHLAQPYSPVALRLQTSRDLDTTLFASQSPSEVEASGAGEPWLGVQEILASDDIRASVSLTGASSGTDALVSQAISISNFGFTVPDNATNPRVAIQVEGYRSCACLNCGTEEHSGCEVIVEASLVAGGEVSFAVPLALGYSESQIGSGTGTFGFALTPSIVNAPDFGVLLNARLLLNATCTCGFIPQYPCPCECNCDGTGTAYIDSVTLMVSYHQENVPTQIDWTFGVPVDDTSVVLAPTADLSSPALTITATGTVRCTDLVETSGRRFKTGVRPLSQALDKVSRLQGVSYHWDEAHGGTPDVGFVAEDVAVILPEVVRWESDGANAAGLNYGRITALLVEAVKEQQAQLEAKDCRLAELSLQNAELQARIDRIEALLGEPRGLTPRSEKE